MRSHCLTQQRAATAAVVRIEPPMICFSGRISRYQFNSSLLTFLCNRLLLTILLLLLLQLAADLDATSLSTLDLWNSSFHVETLAPGSVGMFSGIGPHGMDLPPYGPPVVNFFIRSQGHAPLLGNIPISSKSFYGPDLRRLVVVGSGGSKNGDASAQITSWNAGKNGDISISIDFFLATRPSDGATSSSDDDSTSLSNVLFCPSWFHVSFFAEPIAICAPSLLDFFEL